MDIMMKPIVPGKNAPGAASITHGPEPPETSFSRYIDKKIAADPKKNRLGVKESIGQNAQANKAGKVKNAAKQAADEDQGLSVNELLLQFLRDLRELAVQEKGGGAWTFPVADKDVLERIGLEAGMNEADIARMLQKLEGDEAELSLTEFLDLLARHFEDLAGEKTIAAPETDLALLESFLSRLGLAMDRIKEIAEKSVIGDGNFDLALLLDGLEDLELVETFTLSDWEREQLGDMLSRAGVSEMTRENILSQQSGEIEFSLDVLKDLLGQGIADVEENQAKADLPALLKDLAVIFSEAGLQGKAAGWTPVVQESVAAAYQELLESVDMSTVRVQVMPRKMDIEAALEEKNQAMIDEEMAVTEAENLAEGVGKVVEGHDSDGKSIIRTTEEPAGNDIGDLVNGNDLKPPLSMAEKAALVAENAPRPADPQPMLRQMSVMQQQAFEQISEGVVRGLEKGDHHLVLKLYPPELGEVKVDLLIRDEKVAVSFTMENSRVKETMESNMGDFKDNMEQKGFSMGECMVSVGDHDQPSDAWNRFEQAWKSQRGFRNESLADLPDEVLYNRMAARQAKEVGGINIVV